MTTAEFGNPMRSTTSRTDGGHIRSATAAALDDGHLARVQALAGVGVLQWHPASGAMVWSRQARRMFGFTGDRSPDFAELLALVPDDERAAFDATIGAALERGGRFDRIQRMRMASGDDVRTFRISGEVGDDGRHVLATAADVTEQQAASNDLAYLATHDPLTDLHNRRGLLALIDEQLTQDPAAPGSLLLIDIDHFKDINDLRGHATGDQVMRALASRLAELLPDAGLGRLGGDEFAVVLAGHDLGDARAVAERVCDAVNAAPMMTASDALHLTVSIGVAELRGARDKEAALAAADLALYAAKSAGRNCVRESLPEHHARAQQRLSVHQRLADALADEHLSLLAQPIIDLKTDEISAWELLLRLRDGNQPDLPPGAFIPTAERSSLATRVDRWVVRRAVDALATPAARRRGLCLQVNVTSRSLEDPGFGDCILAALRDAGVSPHRLGLEITETATMTSVAAVRTLVARLGSAGCPIVLDDFGTGFGSLVSLRDVPFAAIKVAGAFVQHAERNAVNLTVLDGIVRLARGLGMQVIAEQVDRAPLLQALREAGVRGAQGYLLGAPRPLDEVLTALG